MRHEYPMLIPCLGLVLKYQAISRVVGSFRADVNSPYFCCTKYAIKSNDDEYHAMPIMANKAELWISSANQFLKFAKVKRL